MNKIENSSEKWVQKDRRVWVINKSTIPNPNQDAFIQAKIANALPKQIMVVIKQNQDDLYSLRQYSVNYQDVQKLTYGQQDVSDMVDLQQLNQPQLLYNLKRRYVNDMIFTFCGPTLVIINPYMMIDKLFNDQLLIEYQAFVFLDTLEYKTLPPHIFSLTAFCLWQLFDNMRNQSIVISGQSGAGKTQNTKFCLKFLASLGKNMKALSNEKAHKMLTSKAMKTINRASKHYGIEDRILGCNEILEAFGNAKTIRNDNSSRFGKLILLLYGENQTDIKSAFIISYLLQKSRIVSIAEGQRNYHIFYYFIKGTSPEEKKQFLLTKTIQQYKYLNQSSVMDIPGMSDETHYLQVHKQFKSYFNEEETTCIFTIISSVLNLGNLTFKKGLSPNNEEMAVVVNKEYLQNLATLLGLQFESLEQCFTYKTRKIGMNVINSPLKYDQAVALQNSFSKNLYEKTFHYLVQKLNEKIELEKVNLDETNKSFRKSIGILDIFGFEVLEINSLEQFFINFANEKLQQLYVSYIFKQQQNEFLKEGLKDFSQDIGFQDNKPVIDLFELYPLGLFHLINQSSELNTPDQNLPQNIVRNHPKNNFLEVPKAKRSMFTISHSCSPVSYKTTGFAQRNKDQFPQQLLQVIIDSENQILKNIIVGEKKQTEVKSRTAAKKFLGSKFLNDMNKLIEELYSSDCHFVRCIKPNSLKAPKKFNSDAVLRSLRYLGVLDSILIRKLGYIYRRQFKEFIKKFFEIEQYIFGWSAFVEGKGQEDFKQYSRTFILKHAPNQLGNRQILLGHKKILIKQSALNTLEAMAKEKRKMRIQCANKIKKMYVNSVFRGKAKDMIKTVAIFKGYMTLMVENIRQKILSKKCSKIQKAVKAFLLERRMQKYRQAGTKAVTRITAFYRMRRERLKFLKIRKDAIAIQANIRFFLSMAAFIRLRHCRQVAYHLFEQGWNQIENQKAIVIQKAYKGYVVRRRYMKVMEQIRKKLKLRKYQQRIMQVIFQHKLKKYVTQLNKYKIPIIKIQVFIRRKLARRTYHKVREAAICIQKAFRRHLKKKYYLIRLWRDYRKNIYLEEKQKSREMSRLYLPRMEVENVKYYPETVVKNMKYYPRQLTHRYGKNEQSMPEWIINQTLTFPDKNAIQLYIGDFDLLGTVHYQGKWLLKYAQIKQELKKKWEYPISINVGQEFTSILSNKERLYTIYASEDSICSRYELQGTSQVLSVGDRAGYTLRNNGSMYIWGYNYGNFLQNGDQVFYEAKEVPKLSKLRFKQIECKGSQRYFIEGQGKVYHYQQHEQEWKFAPFSFGLRSSIKSIALSYSFAMFLNTQGLVYAFGQNNKGQLGLGFASKKAVQQPQPVQYIQQQKQIIQTISAGMSHVVAKSKLGYIYSWGDNTYQQINTSSSTCIHTPEAIEVEDGKLRAYQAVAGLRSTFVLNQQLKIVAFGTSSSFNSQKSVFNYPLETLKQTNNSKGLIEIKISVQWIREMSVLIVSGLDASKCKTGTKPDVVLKYAKMIAKEWQDSSVYPEYHEWCDNILQLSDLRKFKFASSSTPAAKQKTTKGKSELQDLKALVQLRKTSSVFKRAALAKMQECLGKLRSKGEERWSQEEKELHYYIQQNLAVLKGG